MRMKTELTLVLGLALMGATVARAEWKTGTPDLKSASQLAFGPDGVLFIGDTQGAAIFAIDTGDRGPRNGASEVNVEKLNEKVAALLGTDPKQVAINDVAVNPASGQIYLAVTRGQGSEAQPVLL